MSKPHEYHLGHTCGCVPLRYIVTLFMVFMLIFSLCMAVSLVTEDTRVLVGGYSILSRYAVAVLGGIGACFSVGALVAIQDNNTFMVWPFVAFLLLRIAAVLVIFGIDWQELKGCERFSLSGGAFSSVDSVRFNPAIETVALSGHCGQARVHHAVLTAADALVCAYGALITHRWCHAVDNSPSYQISLDETRPLRVYTGFANLGYPAAPPAGQQTSGAQARYAPSYGYAQA
mmetsp:Transcript_1939/g.5243  ORF Transcript_1939/g.5243 Transcript_1939/m.5243 type:complete len:231 (-) Transcript_1939:130-822(-)